MINIDPADGTGVFPIATHAAVAAKLNGLQQAIASHTDLVILNGGPAAMDTDEVIFSGELELDRRPRFFGEHGGDEIGILILILVAESATHVLADDLNLLWWNSQIARRVAAAIGDSLSRRVERQLISLPVSDAGPRFHLRVVDEGCRVAVLEDEVGCLKTLGHVTAASGHGLSPVLGVE